MTKYWLDGSDPWTTAADWTGGTVPGTSDDVTVAQGDPQATTAIGVHSLTLAGGTVDIVSTTGTSTIGTTLYNSGTFRLDDLNYGNGGSVLAVTGAITNSGSFDLGNSGLNAASTITGASIANTGTLGLTGNTATLVTLSIAGAAGFGTAGVVTGDVELVNDALIAFASGQITSIGYKGTLGLTGGSARIASGGTTGTNSGLTGLTANYGTFNLRYGANVSTSSSLTNAGTLRVDANNYGDTGSTLTVTGLLSNTGIAGGNGLLIGNSGLSSNTLVSAGSLSNSTYLGVTGSSGTAKASLVVGAAAGFGTQGTVTGDVELANNALIQFASGQINSIGYNSTLGLNGAATSVADVGGAGTNSALTGLTSIYGTFNLRYGAVVAPTGSLAVTGTLDVDDLSYGDGGSTLSITGALTNGKTVVLGNSGLSANSTISAASLSNDGVLYVTGGTPPSASTTGFQATLAIGAAAGFGTAGAVTGDVELTNNALISFASGQINRINGGQTLILNGPNARLSSGSATTTNSALTGLTAVNGYFVMSNGVTVAPTGGLTVTGTMSIDQRNYGLGGSSLTIKGTLANNSTNGQGTFIGNGGLSAATLVSAAAVTNNSVLSVTGGAASNTTVYQATLAIAGVAGFGTAGVLNGDVELAGNALISFGSGQIVRIGGNATLGLNGASARIADVGTPATNSALAGLGNVAGTLNMAYGATINPTGNLTITGNLNLDANNYGMGGSALGITGALVNNNSLRFGNTGLSANSTISAASLNNTGSLSGGGGDAQTPPTTTGFQSTLAIGSAAGFGLAGFVRGDVELTGNALISFASGQLTTIASNSTLGMNGAETRIADTGGSTTTSTALTGLANNVGTLNLANGASIAPTGNLINSGTINVDDLGYGQGGSNLAVGGILANNGTINFGNNGLGAPSLITAATFSNNTVLSISGGSSNSAVFEVTGSAYGSGTDNIGSGGTLDFDGAVNNQTVNFSGNGGHLVLNAAVNFKGTITNFAGSDVIDAGHLASATVSYTANAANTGGILTVTSGASHAALALTGQYSTANFATSSDLHAGTNITYVLPA